MKSYGNYQKVLDSLFYLKEKPNVIERLNDLFENIIKPSVILTLAEAAAPGLATGYGLGAGSSGKARAPEVSPIIDCLAENSGSSTGCVDVYQKQVNAYIGRERQLFSIFV